MKIYLKEKPKCSICGEEMVLDDVDFNFKGNQDEYYVCPRLNHDYVLVKVRYDKIIKIIRSKRE